jgi:hypothetical protein
MIIQNRSIVNFILVRSCIQRVFPNRVKKIKIAVGAIGTAAIIAVMLFSFFELNLIKFPVSLKSGHDEDQVSLPGKKKIAGLANPQQFAASKKRRISSDSGETLKDNPSKTSDRNTSGYIEPQPPSENIIKKSNQLSLDNSLPEILGKIKLRPNQTLSGLIQTIYGSYNSRHFKSLILINPHIDDPDIVDIGQTVALPAIPANLKPLPQQVWWIKITERNNLEEAFKILETFPDNEPPIRMIPYWNSHKGMKFVVILKKYFLNEENARLQLNRLPLSISSKGKILSSWGVDNVFFADPFLASSLN